ncbi:MAG: cysteine synthase A [Candidatus Eisenbacteria bacterium]|uniref:cysteine synthase n=1 Tax=Eiseniibacteriota bacterium TaxID=2212470 RepID=A0A937X7R2_UNCEI|nr:cysteine synthase A [Candidatus Eisenbacteria bacterium]
MARIHDTILEAIGGTPLVRAPRFSAGLKADVVFKLESFNPMSSVKDRPARRMIEEALESGALRPGMTVVEPTSGNTGIGLALVCAVKGLRLVLTMPETMSIERRKILAALGAELVLTPGELGMKGAIARAGELREEMGDTFMPGQFSNRANVDSHRETTAPEIWHDTDGAVDIFVAGVGTGGTLSGVGSYLKEKKPGVKIVAVEPAGSPVLSGGKPGPHKIQGIGAGFVPQILDVYIMDEIVQVREEDAFAAARDLCRGDGLMVGISSGAVAWACRQFAERKENTGRMIVGLLASHGERYLSTALYQQG